MRSAGCRDTLAQRLARLAGAVVVGAWILLVYASPAAAVQLTRSPYNAPVISDSKHGTLIQTLTRPAGLLYRATLDPDRTYRVRIRGQATAAGIVMRVARNGTLDYKRAPTGLYAFRVTGVEELELLLFGHYETDDESYLVREMTVTACDDCPGDTQLRQQILDERPALAAALDADDSYTAAVEVMRWAAPRIPVPGGEPLPQLATGGLSAAEMYYDNFDSGQVGVRCSGAADFLVKLLALFDIPATELDFGDPAVLTHATVIVPVVRGGVEEYFQLDPTYNARVLMRDSSVPVPLLEALELWRSGNSELLRVDDLSLGPRRIVYDPDRAGVPASLRCEDVSIASGWSGCGLQHLDHDSGSLFGAAGYGRGQDAMFGLLAFGQLFSSEYFRTPPNLLAMLTRLKIALQTGDGDQHVADLALVPRPAGEGPSLTGTPDVGAALRVVPGDWALTPGRWDRVRTPAGTSDLAVQWHRCADACRPIGGAQGMEYRAHEADRGARLLARVRAHNRWGSSRSLDTPLTAAVADAVRDERPAPPVPATTVGAVPARRHAVRVRIAGRARVGRLLRCSVEGAPRSHRMTWSRNRRWVARGRSHVVRRRDVGTRLTCRVVMGKRSLGSAHLRVPARLRTAGRR
jgi:hypothetical protein